MAMIDASASRISAAAWVGGTLALVALTLARWIAAPPSLAIPATPVDRTNSYYARHWALVNEARSVIPPGQTYTVIASDPDSEMLLFMLSLGVLTDHMPFPSSYFRVPMPHGKSARFVVSYDCVEPENARLLRRFPEGCVWERPAAPR
jgi:hypothetical protein